MASVYIMVNRMPLNIITGGNYICSLSKLDFLDYVIYFHPDIQRLPTSLVSSLRFKSGEKRPGRKAPKVRVLNNFKVSKEFKFEKTHQKDL